MSMEGAAFVSALQRAFAEVRHSPADELRGVGIDDAQVRQWRAGRKLPSTFEDLEPLIAYFHAVSDATGSEQRCDQVSAWSTARWRALWKAAGSSPAES